MEEVSNNNEYKNYEIIKLKSNQTRVACDGGGGSLGHPKVWLELENIGSIKSVICPYCSRNFISND